MKRYQCIKNWHYFSDDSDDGLLFKMGICYPETNEEPYLPGNVVIRCEDGNGIQVTPDVIKTYFQELLDLNVDDMEEQEYIMLQSGGCTRTALAICAAAAIGFGITIYLALTWRS